MGTRDFYPPRQSRFVEGSMNDRSGPRSRFWDDHKFDFTFEKNPKATTVTEVPITYDGAEQGAAPSGEGIFGRFSRAATALFRRKKEPQPPAEPPRDTRKEEAERAYHEAKRLGLLPEAKVFVRPGMRAYTAPGTSYHSPIMQHLAYMLCSDGLSTNTPPHPYHNQETSPAAETRRKTRTQSLSDPRKA